MNTDLFIQILQLALSLAQAQLTGKSAQNLAVDQVLLEIVQKGAQAYRLQTGQPLDVSLIKAEGEI
jgi:hypothetical protein